MSELPQSQQRQEMPEDMLGFDAPYNPPAFPPPSYLSAPKDAAPVEALPTATAPTTAAPTPPAAAAPAAPGMTPLVTPPVYEKKPGPPVIRVPARPAEGPIDAGVASNVGAEPVANAPSAPVADSASTPLTPIIEPPVYNQRPSPQPTRFAQRQHAEPAADSTAPREFSVPDVEAFPVVEAPAQPAQPTPIVTPPVYEKRPGPPVVRVPSRVLATPAALPADTQNTPPAPDNQVSSGIDLSEVWTADPAPAHPTPADPQPVFRHARPEPAQPTLSQPRPATNLPPVGATMPARQSAPSVRVPEPMAVLWQGVEYEVENWDVHGFALQSAMPRMVAPGLGRVFDVTLLIGQGGTRIEMRVQARLNGEGDQATRFTFVDLGRPQAEVLHRIVDSVVANKAMSLTKLLNETEETRVARKETGDRMRGFRTVFQLSLAGLVLAAAGMVTWSSFASVRARYAAVTVGATSLSVPIAGRISDISAAPGAQVRTGDVLGYVLPADQDNRIATVIERRNRLEIERAELLARRGAMTQLTDIAVTGNGTERDRIEQSLQIAERRLAVEQGQLATLRSSGLPTPSRLRERARQEAAVLAAQGDVLNIQGRLEDLTRMDVLAPLGVLQGGRTNAATFETVDMRLENIDTEIAALAGRESRAQLGDPILSPCDCTVQQIDRRRGEWASPGDQLAVLVGDEAPTVHALIMSEDARSVDLGDTAQISLADGTSVSGHVTRLNYDPHWRGFAGLQDNVFAADRYARIEITPEGTFRAPVGMVAEVNVHTNALFSGLASLVGL